MDMIQQMLSVFVVLAALGGTLWWLRHKGFAAFAVKGSLGAKVKSMKVIERLALTPQHSLHLVRVADKTMLIATSPGGCSILEGVSDPTVERVSPQ